VGVFLFIAPCSLLEVYRRFIFLLIEAASSSETSPNFYQTERRNNPKRLGISFALFFYSERIKPFESGM
jgi:hypothetical protein